MLTKSDQLAQVAARAAITRHSEDTNDRERLTDDYHDLLNSVIWYLEEQGVELPDPTSAETARAAWL